MCLHLYMRPMGGWLPSPLRVYLHDVKKRANKNYRTEKKKKVGKCDLTLEIALGTIPFVWEPMLTELGIPRTVDPDLYNFNTIKWITHNT